MDPVVLAATIAAVPATIAAVASVRNGRVGRRTHHQVSANSHKSATPTVLDLIAEVRDAQVATHKLMVEHLADHAGSDLRH